MTLAAEPPADMPWWGWIVIALLAAAFLMRAARRLFRRTVEREVVAFLREKRPEIEILERHPRRLAYRVGDGPERRVDLAEVYRAAARLPQRTPEARRAVYERFFAGS